MRVSYAKQLPDAIREFLPSSFFRTGRCVEGIAGRHNGSAGQRS